MGKYKSFILLLTVFLQGAAIVFLFFNLWVSILLFIIYGIAILALFILTVIERIKEKEEEKNNDYRDY
ncbi:hypothetical protein [Pseudalkalibacillus salsuginis]|uniref:hypothetical protein n=1 Tax=Pseudalkalibacillus salsuginis TaxID=2910972 RepID=UPI001F399022|nr:hypothetical protein [Pseudalkalibacillus salsuginis]MCF6411255.1 hypothetical protein [Pseudalkalibacillus salsuginis]